VRRFFFKKAAFSDEKVIRFTQSDGLYHLGLVLVALDETQHEVELVGVVRCFRDSDSADLAEVAVTVVDDWQGTRIGTLLIEALAICAKNVGIHRWKGVFLSSNAAVRRLLNRIGTPESEIGLPADVVECIYRLNP
jgi:GNAT superfamily N-acetyltransferase